MVLNEDEMLTREQLALLILEINGQKNGSSDTWVYDIYDDAYDIADWAIYS